MPIFKKSEAGTVEPWPEKAERLLAAAQAMCSNANKHEEARDGEQITTVDPDDLAELEAVVTEISDEVVALIRKVRADAADES